MGTDADGQLTKTEFISWAMANREMAQLFLPGLNDEDILFGVGADMEGLVQTFFAEQWFNKLDVNQDGQFDEQEFQRIYVVTMTNSFTKCEREQYKRTPSVECEVEVAVECEVEVAVECEVETKQVEVAVEVETKPKPVSKKKKKKHK